MAARVPAVSDATSGNDAWSAIAAVGSPAFSFGIASVVIAPITAPHASFERRRSPLLPRH